MGVQTQGHVWQVLRDIKEIELIEYPTTTLAMVGLDNGLLDAVPENRETGEYYAEQNNWDVKHVGENILSYKICTGFSTIYHESLVERYDKALGSLIDNGKVQKLWESYYGPMTDDAKP